MCNSHFRRFSLNFFNAGHECHTDDHKRITLFNVVSVFLYSVTSYFILFDDLNGAPCVAVGFSKEEVDVGGIVFDHATT